LGGSRGSLINEGAIMSDISIGSLKDNFFYMDFVGKTAPIDIYRLTRTNTGSFRVSTEGFNGGLNQEL
jgi:hypothetical protein